MFVLIGILLVVLFFGLDFLVRRTKWSDNTKDEKVSLIINMITIPIYYLMGSVGILFAMVDTTARTELGKMLFEVSAVLASFSGAVVFAISIASIVLRKKGQTRGSKWVHMGSFIYIMLYAALANFSNML